MGPEDLTTPPTAGDVGPGDGLWSSLRSGFGDGIAAVRWRLGQLRRSPAYRRLRWVLLLGLVIRLVLAPITSWGSDTPDSILSGFDLIYTGSPYSSTLYFNPPLGPLLSAPLYALLSAFIPVSTLVPTYDSVTPSVVASGLTSNLLPSPLALLALKLPLIAADLASTLVLFQLVARTRGIPTAHLVAGAWFLNPLLIWSTAVHGEVDGLATLCILLFVAGLMYDWPIAAGVALALGIFAKAYPAVLLPLGLAVFWFRPSAPGRSWRERAVPLGGFLAGLGLGILPFLVYLPAIAQNLTAGSSSVVYGGISVLVIYNGGVPMFPDPISAIQSHPLAPTVLSGFRVVAVVGILAAPVLLFLYRKRSGPDVGGLSLGVLGAAALVMVLGAILFDPSPQSENMVGPLALVLVAAPLLGRSARYAYVVLSGAAFGLYMALLTPLAYFYPLAVMLGGPSVDYVNSVAVGFATYQGPFDQGELWLLCGLVGGATIVFLWAWSMVRLVRRGWVRGTG